jgi:excinuclease UvrABC helicase subunit UvrB
LRFNAPIYTYEAILAEAGIELTDELEEEPDMEKELEQIKPKKKKPTSASGVEKLKDTSVDKLKEMLEKALEAEDYEKAAKIRDEINRRN